MLPEYKFTYGVLTVGDVTDTSNGIKQIVLLVVPLTAVIFRAALRAAWRTEHGPVNYTQVLSIHSMQHIHSLKKKEFLGTSRHKSILNMS